MKPSAIDDLARDLTEGYLSNIDPLFAAKNTDEQRHEVATAIRHRLEDHGITSAGIAALLNQLLADDPGCVSKLIWASAPANEQIANHPSVVVREIPILSEISIDLFELRVLGLLQGISSMDGHKIMAVYDGEGALCGFEAITNEQFEKLKVEE